MLTMEDKIYYPDTINDNPLPNSTSVSSNVSTSAKKDVLKPDTTPQTPIPTKLIARDTISSSINTRTKKILGEYSFGQVGAIKVGNYQDGISGEINISPNGITAINVNGEVTFFIDATTGDATFRGTLQAGTLIGGDNTVVIEEGSVGGRIVLYNGGVPSILIGDPT